VGGIDERSRSGISLDRTTDRSVHHKRYKYDGIWVISVQSPVVLYLGLTVFFKKSSGWGVSSE
jgi:hypothetical protein